MEFKGTKNLHVDLKHNQVLNTSGVLVIANINDYNGEGKYNTLLYSKSPEMLEMLIEIRNQIEDGRTYITKEDIDKLIKEATEL